MIGIYKITNKINKKCYIGQSINIKERFYGHKSSENNVYLRNAFKKYGIDNFIFEVIEECKREELNQKEIYYIKLYKSTNRKFGYNLSPGGTGREKKTSLRTRRLISKSKKGKLTRTEETEKNRAEKFKKTIANMPREQFEEWHKKIGKRHKNKVVTQEQRDKISKSLKEYYKDENVRKQKSEKQKGKKLSLMTRLKMSMAKKLTSKEQNQRFCKPIVQYDKLGNYITEYKSVKEASDKTNVDGGNICLCCKHKRKTAGGYKWEYKFNNV